MIDAHIHHHFSYPPHKFTFMPELSDVFKDLQHRLIIKSTCMVGIAGHIPEADPDHLRITEAVEGFLRPAIVLLTTFDGMTEAETQESEL
jgi:hypothetical protein